MPQSKQTGDKVYRREVRPVAVALVTPAVRTVAVYVCIYTDVDGIEHIENDFIPIVAIESRIDRVYGKMCYDDYTVDRSGTEEQLLERGWELSEQVCERNALCVTSEFGITSVEECDADNAAYRLQECRWAPEYDKGALFSVVKELEQLVRSKLAIAAERQPVMCKERDAPTAPN